VAARPLAVTSGPLVNAGNERHDRIQLDRWSALTSGLASGLVGLGLLLGWRGVDLPAQLYRVALARSHGLTLWDSQWYGGHWTLDYSVLYPATAAVVGVGALSVMCAAAAALAFDRLVVAQLGRSARFGSLVFALGVIVETSIGQLTFFFGEALALWCVVTASRRHWWLAAFLAAASSLASPLAGAFLVLALGAWWIVSCFEHDPTSPRPEPEAGRRAALVAAAARIPMRPLPLRLLGVVSAACAPILVTSVFFPGQGRMPYPVGDWIWHVAIAFGLWSLTPYSQRILRAGFALYAFAATVCLVVPSPIGGNVGRLTDCLALPLAIVLCWNRGSPARPLDRFPRLAGHPRALLAVIAIPLAVAQCAPAWDAITVNPGRPWTHQAFYAPLVTWLDHQPGPLARVEVVPTQDHWESAYVAPSIPLARGWERQLDVADNPIFYKPDALNRTSYVEWLRDDGARYVALAAAPLDYAGVAEGRLVRSGLPGLSLVWHNADWRVYRLRGSTGIVSGPATLTSMVGGQVSLDVTRPGPVLLRVRWSPDWRVQIGDATLSETANGWMTVRARYPGVVRLAISL
jgi:hypothetical protein